MRLSATILQKIVGRSVGHFSGSGHQRALGRLEVKNPAMLFPVRDNQLEDPFEVKLRDISAETVGIDTSRAMMPSAKLVIDIRLSESETLAIQCRVTRCSPGSAGRFILAAQFVRMIDPDILSSPGKSIS
jgi:PilZ domain